MFNDILNGITSAIYNEFGDLYNIYINQEEQGVDEPCFFVYCINSNETQMTMNRYHLHTAFSITYFPKTEEQVRKEADYYEPYKECNDVKERLYTILRMVKLEDGSIIRGTNMNAYIEDNHLMLMVDYDMYVRRTVTPEETMQQLSQKARKRG